MASQTRERAGNIAAGGAKSISHATDTGREVADALDDAADTTGEQRKTDSDAEEIGRDVMRAATAHPVASLLVLSAVVIGGTMLVAAMLEDDGPADASWEPPRPTRLAMAVSGLGPKGTETLRRLRDAAFSFAFDKALDRVDAVFPGFREHYERASHT